MMITYIVLLILLVAFVAFFHKIHHKIISTKWFNNFSYYSEDFYCSDTSRIFTWTIAIGILMGLTKVIGYKNLEVNVWKITNNPLTYISILCCGFLIFLSVYGAVKCFRYTSKGYRWLLNLFLLWSSIITLCICCYVITMGLLCPKEMYLFVKIDKTLAHFFSRIYNYHSGINYGGFNKCISKIFTSVKEFIDKIDSTVEYFLKSIGYKSTFLSKILVYLIFTFLSIIISKEVIWILLPKKTKLRILYKKLNLYKDLSDRYYNRAKLSLQADDYDSWTAESLHKESAERDKEESYKYDAKARKIQMEIDKLNY